MDNFFPLILTVDTRGHRYWNGMNYTEILLIGKSQKIPRGIVNYFLKNYKNGEGIKQIAEEVKKNKINPILMMKFLAEVLKISMADAIVLFQSNY